MRKLSSIADGEGYVRLQVRLLSRLLSHLLYHLLLLLGLWCSADRAAGVPV